MVSCKVSIILVACCFLVYGDSALTTDEMLLFCLGNEPNTVIADPSDEHKYILCTANTAYSQTCAGDKCFNANVSPPCGVCLATDLETYCKSDDKTWLELVANEDCEYYTICLGKDYEPITEKCPQNQHFSAKELKCTSPYEAGCSPPTKWCHNKPNGVKFAAWSCSKYYECFNLETISKSCSYNEYFDVQSNKCLQGSCTNDNDIDTDVRKPTCTIYDDGVSMAHAKCNKFYFCANEVAYEGQCPTGYAFDDTLNICARDYTNICNDN